MIRYDAVSLSHCGVLTGLPSDRLCPLLSAPAAISSLDLATPSSRCTLALTSRLADNRQDLVLQALSASRLECRYAVLALTCVPSTTLVSPVPTSSEAENASVHPVRTSMLADLIVPPPPEHSAKTTCPSVSMMYRRLEPAAAFHPRLTPSHAPGVTPVTHGLPRRYIA